MRRSPTFFQSNSRRYTIHDNITVGDPHISQTNSVDARVINKGPILRIDPCNPTDCKQSDDRPKSTTQL